MTWICLGVVSGLRGGEGRDGVIGCVGLFLRGLGWYWVGSMVIIYV